MNRLWSPNSEHIYVCSAHFVSGKKSSDSHYEPEPVLFPDVGDLRDEEDFINSSETETLSIEKSEQELLHDEIANLRREKDESLKELLA
ncbi:hypothetical protein WMY93_027118 [Mugilogobius chulae]|uniref:Uncharacterized protein n=1 Tax=Mugilogobius chulae TaxID=88201 RepID=A0AAW0MW38_9GOBI